jgi:hypothetical protein
VAERSRAATATGRSFVAEAIVRHIAKLTIAFVAKRKPACPTGTLCEC